MKNEIQNKHMREREILSNPPIVEAIFEIQWLVLREGEFPPLNEKFKLLPGRLYDKVQHLYPYIEVLPNSTIPDEMNPNVPRYRFRSKKDGYPLIQVGPGVLTINLDKTNFLSQNRFFDISMEILNMFFSIINIELTQIRIHYIDAFDYKEENIFDFLRNKLQMNIEFQPELFKRTGIKPNPDNISFETNYRVDKPKSIFVCKIRNGKKSENEEIILMDTMCISRGSEVPAINKIDEWLIEADDLIHEWFYEMIRNYKEIW